MEEIKKVVQKLSREQETVAGYGVRTGTNRGDLISCSLLDYITIPIVIKKYVQNLLLPVNMNKVCSAIVLCLFQSTQLPAKKGKELVTTAARKHGLHTAKPLI